MPPFFKNKFDLESFIAGSMEGLQLATAGHASIWHLGEEQSWDVDQDDGGIVWQFADGTVARADVQIVGTYNAADGTFLWGWNHPSVVPALQQHAATVQAFGMEHDLEELTTQKVSCSEERAWQYTALAMRLAQTNGAYRAKAAPGTWVYFTFGEVSLRKE